MPADPPVGVDAEVGAGELVDGPDDAILSPDPDADEAPDESATSHAPQAAAAPSVAAGGAIAGRVTLDDDPELGVSAVTVSARQVGGAGYGETTTEHDGHYRLEGLPGGDYILLFESDGDYAFEFWGDTADEQSAVLVTVTEGASQEGVDAQLAWASFIDGTAFRYGDGLPVRSVWAAVYTLDDVLVDAVQTDDTGHYRIGGLPAGSYIVYFESDEDTFVPQFWQDAFEREDATAIELGVGETANADVWLQPNQSISGTVTRSSDGAPVNGFVWASGDSGFSTSVDIDDGGSYTLFLPPGTYTLQFVSRDQTALGEYWRDARDGAEATPIAVDEGAHLEGIDAVLEATALITGTIEAESRASYATFVEAYDGATLVAMAYADDRGRYTLHVPAGTYIVRASAVMREGHVEVPVQYFDHVATAEEATPITVAEGEIRAGVDFALTATVTPTEPSLPPIDTPGDAGAQPTTGALASTGSEPPLPAVAVAAIMLIAGALLATRGRRRELTL
ncbi:carboxypeptidase-like regulatory domain-containing protein [Microbacterium sp.]|uniref:MSCRAMM family protein n=1 Tax=Microbacterium sp. TaxID=51671 RepID=UPI002811E262|nr:carboxypeptidase-like regulatory domain-containing protein [Microbacterium sp.]